MNCPQARFLLYAHFDRELTQGDAEELSRHLALCAPCRSRAESARGLARLLHSRSGRALAPNRLRSRLQMLPFEPARPRTASYLFAAAMTLLIVPLVADGPAPRRDAADPNHFPEATQFLVAGGDATPVAFVSKRLSGTFVCVQCEGRAEAGFSPAGERVHVPGFCAENGEIWRLMTRDPHFGDSDLGRSATLEGTAFPQSGFLRANRVGY